MTFSVTARVWRPGVASHHARMKEAQAQGGRAFLGRCSEDMTSTWSLMPAMVTTPPNGSCPSSGRPLGGSASVRPAVVGTITLSGIARTSGAKSRFAEKVLALRAPAPPLLLRGCPSYGSICVFGHSAPLAGNALLCFDKCSKIKHCGLDCFWVGGHSACSVRRPRLHL